MKVLVTGAAGFVGFHLVQELLREKFVVVGLDNINDYYDPNLKYARLAETGIYSPNEPICNGGKNRSYQEISFSKGINSVTDPNYSFIRLNLEDKDGLLSLFEAEKFDYVINLAAQAGVRYSIENPDVYIQSNIVGFLNILEACRNNKIKHLIYASSSSVYGANTKTPFTETDQVDHPISLYAATKKSNELMAHVYSHLYQLPTTGLRFFTVYGPWGRPDMAPMLFAKAIMDGKPIKVFNDGKMERDFTYVSDIVRGVFLLLKSTNQKSLFNIFNIGKGSPVQLLDFIKCLENSFESKVEKTFLPIQDGDVVKTWADTNGLIDAFGYQPNMSVKEGIEAFAKWFKDYYQD